MNPALGAKEKQRYPPPSTAAIAASNRRKQQQQQQSSKICNHNCRPKITQLHKQFIHQTKKFTHNSPTKVTNFSPNLLASLKFLQDTT
jgi:hypothetical protein